MELLTLTEVLNSFKGVLGLGRASIAGHSLDLFTVLATIELTIAAAYWVIGSEFGRTETLKRLMVVGFTHQVVRHYSTILDLVINGFVQAGSIAGNGKEINIQTLEDPDKFISLGMTLSANGFKHLSFWDVLSSDTLLVLIGSLTILAAFAYIGIQMFRLYLQYLIVSSIGLILIPFGAFKPTAPIAERVYGSILSYGAHLMVLAFLAAITESIFAGSAGIPETAAWPDVMVLAGCALSVAALTKDSEKISQALLNGQINLRVGSWTGAAQQVTQSSGSVVSAAAAGAIGGYAGAQSIAKGGAFGMGVLNGSIAAQQGGSETTHNTPRGRTYQTTDSYVSDGRASKKAAEPSESPERGAPRDTPGKVGAITLGTAGAIKEVTKNAAGRITAPLRESYQKGQQSVPGFAKPMAKPSPPEATARENLGNKQP